MPALHHPIFPDPPTAGAFSRCRRFAHVLALLSLSLALSLLGACSPHHDWREVHGQTAPYTVLLPARPVYLNREINLDGLRVDMQMTAARVDDISFAVGSASLPEPALAARALESMQTAMVRNIGGRIVRQRLVAAAAGIPGSLEIEVSGHGQDGQPVRLAARFASKGRHVYQAVALGGEKAWPAEAVETFLVSFEPG